MYLSILLLAVAIANVSAVSNTTKILLNTQNVIHIRGEINHEMASKFVYDLNQKTNKKDLYVFIDSNGGSVDAGSQIVHEIQTYNLDCIARRAISMGFIIFQSCNKRYIMQHGNLMQHQMSYQVSGEKAKIEHYVEYVKQMGEYYDILQANKIGISMIELKEKTYNDWWLFGHNAVSSGCADGIASVQCSSALTNQSYVKDWGMYTYTYSKCPLVTEPIQKKKNGNKLGLADLFVLHE